MSDERDDELRSQERGRYFARVELLTWRLKKINEIVFGLSCSDAEHSDRDFNLGRIEELSK